MDRLQAMTTFATIVDSGSLSAAGRALGMPLATVSRQLADLEAHLQVRLLTRSTRRLALTEAGRDYLTASRRILEQVHEAETAATGATLVARGELVVAAPFLFGRLHVVPVVATYLSRYPDVTLRLRLGDRNIDLLEEQVDLALRVGVLPDSGLVAIQVGQVGHVVCASPAYLAVHGTPRRPADLAAHRCITFEGQTAATHWRFRGPAEMRIEPLLAVTTADGAITAALAGVGIARVMSYQAAEALADGTLVRLLAAHEPPPVPVSLLVPGVARLPMKTRAFIDHAVPALRERIAHVAPDRLRAPPHRGEPVMRTRDAPPGPTTVVPPPPHARTLAAPAGSRPARGARSRPR